MQVAIGLLGVVVGCVYLAWFAPTLDGAQAKFEASDEGRGYNWPVFRQANSLAKLKCRDVRKVLRVCDVVFPTIDPMTGQSDGWKHEPFACDTVTCGWLTD